MTRSAKTCAVTIFEGPDGAGKSTLAQEYAQLTQARYVHHGPYKQVGDGLSRMFVESMLPALLGYQDVVLDRCWISEPIYADVFREGNDRVGAARSRILDRLALRCGAVVVKCLPPWESVKATFNSRRDEEYLDHDGQLFKVYDEYAGGEYSCLHEVHYDWTEEAVRPLSVTAMSVVKPMVERLRPSAHSIRVNSSGNWDARVVIVGEDFGEHKNNDARYQHPFGSFNGNGCSLWLADQLDHADISEQSLLWVNADELELVPEFVEWHDGKRFITLGDKASEVVGRLQAKLPSRGFTRTHLAAPHPQYWKRFQASFPYPLIKILKETLRDPHSN